MPGRAGCSREPAARPPAWRHVHATLSHHLAVRICPGVARHGGGAARRVLRPRSPEGPRTRRTGRAVRRPDPRERGPARRAAAAGAADAAPLARAPGEAATAGGGEHQLALQASARDRAARGSPGPSADAVRPGTGRRRRGRRRSAGSDGALLPLLWRAAHARRPGEARAWFRLPHRQRHGPHQQPRGRDPGPRLEQVPPDGRHQGDHRRDLPRRRPRVRGQGDQQRSQVGHRAAQARGRARGRAEGRRAGRQRRAAGG